jgi:hypothetical protein
MTSLSCSKCGRTKPASAFNKNKSRTTGHESECRRCRKDRENTPEARENKRFASLLRKYGITKQEYTDRFIAQSGFCGICGEMERRVNEFGEPLPLVVDHNHSSGKVRGLLCHDCNKAIGLLKDNWAIANSACLYLARIGWRE